MKGTARFVISTNLDSDTTHKKKGDIRRRARSEHTAQLENENFELQWQIQLLSKALKRLLFVETAI
jgi:hypothetical protein